MGLRSKIDSSAYGAAARAGFAKDAFGAVAARQPARTHETPVWMGNDAMVAEFIRKMFPRAGKFGSKCGCHSCINRQNAWRKLCRCRYCRDTVRATQWHGVIVRWFRLKLTDAKIEMEYGWKPGTVGSIVQKIRRAIDGQRQDGLPRTGRPRGRPKKIAASEPIIPDNQETPLSEVHEIESTVFANSC